MKTRWGSCTPATGRMRFNFFLTTVRPEVIDSVVLHELTHVKIANHQREFYDFLNRYMSNYKELKAELNSTGTNTYLVYGN